MDLVSKNLEIMLGLHERVVDDASATMAKTGEQTGWVAWEGDWTMFGGRVRAVKAPGVDDVHLF
jgi:hypothetical protein